MPISIPNSQNQLDRHDGALQYFLKLIALFAYGKRGSFRTSKWAKTNKHIKAGGSNVSLQNIQLKTKKFPNIIRGGAPWGAQRNTLSQTEINS